LNFGDRGPDPSISSVIAAWPANNISEPLNPAAFSTEFLFTHPNLTVPEFIPVCQPDGATRPGKRKRKPTSSQETKKAQALALVREAFQLSDDAYAKVRQLIEEATSHASQGFEAAHRPRQIALENNVASPKRDPYTNYRPCGSNRLSPTDSRLSVDERSNAQDNSYTTVQHKRQGGLVSTASSICHEETSSNRTIRDGNHLWQRTVYSCTFPSCTTIHGSKYQWKRHEESIHKRRFMCKECEEFEGHNSPIVHSSGVYGCYLCLEQFTNLEAANSHTVLCNMARSKPKEYGRIDHLREHLRKEHGILEASKDAFDLFYDMDIEWTRECGFCGVNFHDWELRANHIGNHFKAGWTISKWMVPFPKDKLDGREGPKDGPQDKRDGDDDNGSDDNDSNDDFPDHKGKGHILAPEYRQTHDRSAHNEFSSSGIGWSYGFSINTQQLLLDQFIVSPCTSNSGDKNSQANSTSMWRQAITHLSRHSNSSMFQWRTLTKLLEQFDKKSYKHSPCLEAYLVDQQQHELFLLGVGRQQPSNIYIGNKQPSESCIAVPEISPLAQQGSKTRFVLSLPNLVQFSF